MGLAQRFSPLPSWWEACHHPGRHGTGERAESPTSCSEGSQEETTVIHTGQSLSIYITSKPCLTVTYFANKATPPPIRPHLLIVPLPMGQAFKHMSLWGPSYSTPTPTAFNWYSSECAWLWGHPVKHGKPTSGHTSEEGAICIFYSVAVRQMRLVDCRQIKYLQG